jgi:hypothetical protein
MTRHLTSKHNILSLISVQRKTTEHTESSNLQGAKAPKFNDSAEKKLVSHKLPGSDVHADQQWNVAEYILTECLSFSTAEKRCFRDLPGASEYWKCIPVQQEIMTEKSLLRENVIQF